MLMATKMLLPMEALWVITGSVIVAFLVECGIIGATMGKLIDGLASDARKVDDKVFLLWT